MENQDKIQSIENRVKKPYLDLLDLIAETTKRALLGKVGVIEIDAELMTEEILENLNKYSISLLNNGIVKKDVFRLRRSEKIVNLIDGKYCFHVIKNHEEITDYKLSLWCPGYYNMHITMDSNLNVTKIRYQHSKEARLRNVKKLIFDQLYANKNKYIETETLQQYIPDGGKLKDYISQIRKDFINKNKLGLEDYEVDDILPRGNEKGYILNL